MERRSLALRAMIKKHRPKTENLDPRKWMREETVRGFTDFILNKHSDTDTDKSFDSNDMREYACKTNLVMLGKNVKGTVASKKTNIKLL